VDEQPARRRLLDALRAYLPAMLLFTVESDMRLRRVDHALAILATEA